VVNDDLGVGSDGLRFVLKELDMPRSSIDLLLDLGNLPTDNTFLLSKIVEEEVLGFKPLDGWRSIAVVGTSFPPNLSEVVEHNSFNLLQRVEMGLWRRLYSTIGSGLPIDFGDYGVVCADPPPGHRGAANLRYTVNEQWYVERGYPRDDATSDDHTRLARNLRALDLWRGENHCPGCRFIQDRVDDGRPGNATQWRKAEFDHHFVVVGEALSQVA
jgi:hypothetical protein